MSLWSWLFGSPSKPTTSASRTAAPEPPHYTEQVSSVEDLKREGRYPEAEAILLRSIAEVEREAQAEGKGWVQAPWYTRQLAIIRRKQGNYAGEVEILERYLRQQRDAKLQERLDKARVLLAKHPDGRPPR